MGAVVSATAPFPGARALELPWPVTDFTVGYSICVLREGGEVFCGDFKRKFEQIPLSAPAVALSANAAVTCALLDSGGVSCWGCQTDRDTRTGQVRLSLPRMKSIALGQFGGCGKTADDKILCWGELKYQQRRVGGDEVCNSGQQETVSGTANVAAVALSPESEAATVWVLGTKGRLSVREELPEPDGTDQHRPIERRWRRDLVNVPAPGRVVALGVGGVFEESWFPRVDGCVLHFDGRVECEHGPMLRGVVLPDWAAVNAGRWRRSFAHACALLKDGRVACWGDNHFGQAPPRLAFSEPATALAIGGDHGCALLRDETVSCWGATDWRSDSRRGGPCRCSDGHFASCDSHPQVIPSLTRVRLLRAASDGGLATCAVTAGRSLVCWGQRGWRDCARHSSQWSAWGW
jgi:hypothetical protein